MAKHFFPLLCLLLLSIVLIASALLPNYDDDESHNGYSPFVHMDPSERTFREAAVGMKSRDKYGDDEGQASNWKGFNFYGIGNDDDEQKAKKKNMKASNWPKQNIWPQIGQFMGREWNGLILRPQNPPAQVHFGKKKLNGLVED